MENKISTISWIWDRYGSQFTEIRKAINDRIDRENIPTNRVYLKTIDSRDYKMNEFNSQLK